MDDYIVKRVPEFTFTTTELSIIERARKALLDGVTMRVCRPQWCGEAYCMKYTITSPIDGLDQATITVRPTGAPLRLTGLSPDYIIVDDPCDALVNPELMWEWYMSTMGRRAIEDCFRDYFVNPHPNCRCTPVGITSEKAMMNKCCERDYDNDGNCDRHPGRYNKMGEWKPVKEEPVKELKKFYVGRPGVARSAWAKDTLAEAIEHAKELVEKTGEEQVIVKVIRVVRRVSPPIIVETV